MLRLLLALAVLTLPSDIPPHSRLTLREPIPQAPLAQTRGIVSARQIKGLCTAAEDAKDGQFEMCLGYLAGSLDQLVAQDGINGKSARRLCPGTTITLEEFRMMVVQYIELNPELESAAAAPVIERAVVPALSCDLFTPFAAR